MGVSPPTQGVTPMTQPAAYNYVRFSHPDQAKGDSLRRQEAAVRDWCKRNGVTFDTRLSLRALGNSAFTGDHRHDPSRYALAGFLELVRKGKIAKGSYLIVESLDRLTRESDLEATGLLVDLLRAGIKIVQLVP